MRKLFRGSVINFHIEKPYDYFEISDKREYQGNPFYIPLEFVVSKEYANTKMYDSLGNDQLVVKFIKCTTQDSTTGLLKYREFEDIIYTKEDVVSYEVYKLEDPFLISEYFDGSSIVVKFRDVKIDYRILCKGFLSDLSDDTYRINGTDLNFIVTGPNFHYVHNTSYKCKYNFNIIKVLKKIQVKIFPKSLIEKYAELDDLKKDEIVNFYNKNVISAADNIKLEFDINIKYTEERIYNIDDVLIFNTDSDANFKSVLEDSKILEQIGRKFIFDGMEIFIMSEYIIDY